MKTIITLILILFIGGVAQAQNGNGEVKEETTVMTIVTSAVKQEVAVKQEKSVARLYMFKNSRVKKELNFNTKKNTAKLA